MAALVALALGTSGSGCSRQRAARDERLVIWESYTNDEHAVFLELVALYRRMAGVDSPAIDVQRLPDDGLLPKLITAAIAHETPDLCRVNVGSVSRLAYGGLAMPLDDFGVRAQLDELLPVVAASNTVTLVEPKSGVVTSHVYGVSDQLTCVALYYNKDLFAAAGISAPPRTLDELVSYAQRLTDRPAGRYGLALNHTLWWDLPFLYLFDADVVTPDNMHARLGEDNARRALEFLHRLSADGIEAGAWRAGAINPDQGFVNGRYAMVVSGPWNLQTYKGVNFGVALLPGQAKNTSATNIGGTSMVVLRNSRHQAAAYAFLRFLTSYEAQRVWSERTGQFSVNRRVNAERAPHLTPAMRTFVEQLTYARARPRLPNYDRLENIVNPLFYSIIEGTMDAGVGLTKANALIETEILSELRE